MTEPSDPKGTAGLRTPTRRKTAAQAGGSKPLRDAPGQIPCLILSLPLVGLLLVAVIVGVFVFSDRVADWAINTPLGRGFTGLGLILTGAGMAKLIVAARSDPRATLAGRLVGLGIAALLGALGVALLVAAITHQPAPSTF